MCRMNGRIVLALLSLLCAASPSPASPTESISAPTLSGKPNLRSESVLILDQSSSAVLYSRQADVPTPIASITKLMTALVVLDGGQPLDEIIEVTSEDRSAGKGAYSRLPVGAKLSRGDLLHLALMSSENRAAHALGRTYPGGLVACVRAMNARAQALHMYSTRFVDPSGLSSGNVASPLDLAKLVIAAARNPTIREFSTDGSYTVQVGRHALEFRNTNSLVNNPSWEIIVQKTGYIAEAGRCLVLQAIIEGRAIVIVLLDSFGKYTRTADARRIRTWMESALHAGGASAVNAPGASATVSDR